MEISSGPVACFRHEGGRGTPLVHHGRQTSGPVRALDLKVVEITFGPSRPAEGKQVHGIAMRYGHRLCRSRDATWRGGPQLHYCFPPRRSPCNGTVVCSYLVASQAAAATERRARATHREGHRRKVHIVNIDCGLSANLRTGSRVVNIDCELLATIMRRRLPRGPLRARRLEIMYMIG